MEVSVERGLSHHAARIGCVLFDWTYRQFDEFAPWPKITVDPEAWFK